MTGLSVLFNLNTEEACYIYGNMDSYRRMNEQSVQDRYSSGVSGKFLVITCHKKMWVVLSPLLERGHPGRMRAADAQSCVRICAV